MEIEGGVGYFPPKSLDSSLSMLNETDCHSLGQCVQFITCVSYISISLSPLSPVLPCLPVCVVCVSVLSVCLLITLRTFSLQRNIHPVSSFTHR